MAKFTKLPDHIMRECEAIHRNNDFYTIDLLALINALLASGKARVFNDFVLIDELQPPLKGKVLIINLE